MKVITDSKVTIVGSTQFIPHPNYAIPADGMDAERLGAFAAKGCYDSFGDDGRPCIENQRQIIDHLHGSVLEHSYVSLFIEGVTRALTLELNRHRLFNISQRSTRYVKEEDSAIVLEPYYADIWNRYKLEWDTESDWLTVPEQRTFTKEENPDLWMLFRFLDQCKSAILEYKTQTEILVALNPNKLTGFDLRKWARGKARNVLPHALETRGTWTMNHRAWRWFIEARSSRHAEPELRRLAEKVLVALNNIAPTYYEDFHLRGIVDNIPEYVPTHHKV